jgi:choline dehydrogenase
VTASTNGYDAIVIGAGSAGCLLAARLSDEPDRRVLLLEAGPDYPSVESLPADIADGRRVAESHDWGLRSEAGAGGATLDVPRGRIVGGSSAVNACFALRGHPADYDAWAAMGNTGWSFADVLPAFRTIERDLDHGSRPWHGDTGPLPIRRYPHAELTPVNRAFIEAAVAAGYPHIADHNLPGAVGVGPLPTNCVHGRRISSALAFLAPVRRRPNLTIRPDVLVDRISVRHGRADGVILAGGERLDAEVVVLAAGAYGSPTILLRSGIGPARDLARLGIRPVADLPGVGRGLVDHPAASVDFAAPAAWPAEPTFQSVATFHSAGADPAGSPDLQMFPGGTWTNPASPTGRVAVLVAAVLKPTSRGRVWLRSADPADPPHIDLGHLRERTDLDRLVEAMHRARRVAAVPPLRALVHGGTILNPEPAAWAADAAVARWLQRHTWTYHHPVGTCRMGTDPDDGAVVSQHGKAHGLTGLTIADASIMPDIPAANTNLAVIMLAHRIAERLSGGATITYDALPDSSNETV